jgi:hypothetical protein
VIEQVLERWSEQINNQDVVEPFLTKVIDIGNAGCCLEVSQEYSQTSRSAYSLTASDQDLVCAVFIAQLWCITLSGLELDGHLGVVEQIRSLEDHAKASFSAVVVSMECAMARLTTLAAVEDDGDSPNLLSNTVMDSDHIATAGRATHIGEAGRRARSLP